MDHCTVMAKTVLGGWPVPTPLLPVTGTRVQTPHCSLCEQLPCCLLLVPTIFCLSVCLSCHRALLLLSVWSVMPSSLLSPTDTFAGLLEISDQVPPASSGSSKRSNATIVGSHSAQYPRQLVLGLCGVTLTDAIGWTLG